MKKIVLRFGIYSALAELLAFVACWLILTVSTMSIDAQGNLGWAAILCPLVFIYFGIRYYRDRVNEGSIGFLKAIKIGLLILIMPSLFYALIETIYVIWIDPKFYENIYLRELETYRKTLSASQYAAKLKVMKQSLARNNNPVYNFTTVAMLIASCGIIIVLLSLLLMRRPKLVVATAAS
jgi:hypothetical protein